MGLDGALGDEEPLGDLAVAPPLRGERGDAVLGRGERVDAREGGPARPGTGAELVTGAAREQPHPAAACEVERLAQRAARVGAPVWPAAGRRRGPRARGSARAARASPGCRTPSASHRPARVDEVVRVRGTVLGEPQARAALQGQRGGQRAGRQVAVTGGGREGGVAGGELVELDELVEEAAQRPQQLPLLFARAGVGAPDGTDVAGRIEPLATASTMLATLYRSVLPVARSLGLTTDDRSARWFEQLARDAGGADAHTFMWPLLIGAWKRKPSRPQNSSMS